MPAFTRRFNSYGGPDIQALFNNVPFADLQHISFNIVREKARIFTLGSPDARSFSRGKRSIGGVMVFVLFDRNSLISAFKESRTQGQGGFYTSGDEIRTDSGGASNVAKNTLSQRVVQPGVFNPLGQVQELPAGQLVVGNELHPADADTSNFFSQLADPWYVDQIPPFQISVVAANEYGSISTMKLFNVELMEEGSGVGVDDLVIEQQYTFICTGIQPWTLVQEGKTGFGTIE